MKVYGYGESLWELARVYSNVKIYGSFWKYVASYESIWQVVKYVATV